MFRKTHSRISRPGLAAALMAAFGNRIMPVLGRCRDFCIRHPKKIFCLMVFLMASSMVLCFSVMRMEKPVLATKVSPIVATKGASSGIGMTIDKLQRVMALQSELQAMAKKDSLSKADSLRFAAMLGEIRALTTNK